MKRLIARISLIFFAFIITLGIIIPVEECNAFGYSSMQTKKLGEGLYEFNYSYEYEGYMHNVSFQLDMNLPDSYWSDKYFHPIKPDYAIYAFNFGSNLEKGKGRELYQPNEIAGEVWIHPVNSLNEFINLHEARMQEESAFSVYKQLKGSGLKYERDTIDGRDAYSIAFEVPPMPVAHHFKAYSIIRAMDKKSSAKFMENKKEFYGSKNILDYVREKREENGVESTSSDGVPNEELISKNGYGSLDYNNEIPFNELILDIRISGGSTKAIEKALNNIKIKNYKIKYSYNEKNVEEEDKKIPVIDKINIVINSKKIKDGNVIISGTIKSSSEVTNHSIVRIKGGEAREGFIAISGDRFEATCPIQKGEENIFKISMSNEKGKDDQVEVVMSQKGGLTEREEKNSEGYRGNKGTRKVPGPKNAKRAAAGVLIPGLIAGLGMVIGNSGGTTPDEIILEDDGERSPDEGIDLPDIKEGPQDGDKMVLTGDGDGRTYELEYDSKIGAWINTQTGNPIDIEKFNKWQKDLIREKKWNDREFEKNSKRQTLHDRETDEIMRKIKVIDQIESGKLFEKHDLFSDEEIEKIKSSASEWKRKLLETGNGDGEYEKITRVIKNRLSGKTLDENMLPTYNDSMLDIMETTAANMTDEIVNGKSKKAIALRVLIGVATGTYGGALVSTAVEGFFEGASALYKMKKYVDKGGNSVLEAFNSAVGDLLIGEGIGRVIGGTISIAGGVGESVLKEAGEWFSKNYPGKAKILTDMLTKAKKISQTDITVNSVTKGIGNIKNKIMGETVENTAESMGKGANEALEQAIKRQEYYDNLSIEVSRAKASADARIEKYMAEAGELKSTPSIRDQAYKEGLEKGIEKVKRFEQAKEIFEESPNSLKAKQDYMDALKDIQSDKHAQNAMSRVKGETGDELRIDFNDSMEKTYNTTDVNVKKRIAQEYGVDPEDGVKIVNPTNKSDVGEEAFDPKGFAKDKKVYTNAEDYKVNKGANDNFESINRNKMRYDRDVTVRVKTKDGYVDVPKSELKRIYNEEFYKTMNNGKLPMRKVESIENINGKNVKTIKSEIDYEEIDKFAKNMDQATTDRLDAEAYGNSDLDLKIATNDQYKKMKFSDAETVGKTMEYKAHEWDNMGNDFRKEAQRLQELGYKQKAAELYQKAEACTAESFRQTTKQYKNLVEARVNILNELEGYPPGGAAKIPSKLREAVEIMKMVETGDLTPNQAEEILYGIGYTPSKAASECSAIIEGLQKLKPNSFT